MINIYELLQIIQMFYMICMIINFLLSFKSKKNNHQVHKNIMIIFTIEI